MDLECNKCVELNGAAKKFRYLLSLNEIKSNDLLTKEIKEKEILCADILTLNARCKEKDDKINLLENQLRQLDDGEIHLLKKSNTELKLDVEIKERYIKTLVEVENENKKLLAENKALQMEALDIKEKLIAVTCKNCETLKDTVKTLKVTLKDVKSMRETESDNTKNLQNDFEKMQREWTKLNEHKIKLEHELDLKNQVLSNESLSLQNQVKALKEIIFSQSNQLRNYTTKYCKVCKETASIVFNCFNHNLDWNARTSVNKELLNHYKSTKITLLSHMQKSLIDEMIGDNDMKLTMDNIDVILKKAQDMTANELSEKEGSSVENKSKPKRMTRSVQSKSKTTIRHDRSPSFDPSNCSVNSQDDHAKIRENNIKVNINKSSNNWDYNDLFATNNNNELEKESSQDVHSDYNEKGNKNSLGKIESDKKMDLHDCFGSDSSDDHIEIKSTKNKKQKTPSKAKATKLTKKQKLTNDIKDITKEGNTTVKVRKNAAKPKTSVKPKIDKNNKPRVTKSKKISCDTAENDSKNMYEYFENNDIKIVLEPLVSVISSEKESTSYPNLVKIDNVQGDTILSNDTTSLENVPQIDENIHLRELPQVQRDKILDIPFQSVICESTNKEIISDTVMKVSRIQAEPEVSSVRNTIIAGKSIDAVRVSQLDTPMEVGSIQSEFVVSSVQNSTIAGESGNTVRLHSLSHQIDNDSLGNREMVSNDRNETKEIIDTHAVLHVKDELYFTQEKQLPTPLTTQDNLIVPGCVIIISDSESEDEFEKTNESTHKGPCKDVINATLQVDKHMTHGGILSDNGNDGVLDLRVEKHNQNNVKCVDHKAAVIRAEDNLQSNAIADSNISNLTLPFVIEVDIDANLNKKKPESLCETKSPEWENIFDNDLSENESKPVCVSQESLSSVKNMVDGKTLQEMKSRTIFFAHEMAENEKINRNGQSTKIIEPVVKNTEKIVNTNKIASVKEQSKLDNFIIKTSHNGNSTQTTGKCNVESNLRTIEQDRNDEIKKRTEDARLHLLQKEATICNNKGSDIKTAPLLSRNNDENPASLISKLVSQRTSRPNKRTLSVMDKLKKTADKSLNRTQGEPRPITDKQLVIPERSTKQQLDNLRVSNSGPDYLTGNKRTKIVSDDIDQPSQKKPKLIERKQVVTYKEPSKFMDVKIAQLLTKKLKNGDLVEKFQRISTVLIDRVLLPDIDELHNKYRSKVEEIFRNNIKTSDNELKTKLDLELSTIKDWDMKCVIEEILEFIHSNSGPDFPQRTLLLIGVIMITSLVMTMSDLNGYYQHCLFKMIESSKGLALSNIILVHTTVLTKRYSTIVSFIIDLMTLPSMSMLKISMSLSLKCVESLGEEYGTFISLMKQIVAFELTIKSDNDPDKCNFRVANQSKLNFWLDGKNCDNYEKCSDLNKVLSSVRNCMERYMNTGSNTNWGLLERVVQTKYK